MRGLMEIVLFLNLCVVFASVGYKSVKLSCAQGLMTVEIDTHEDFYGVIYTRGSYMKTGCSYDADGGTHFRLDFPLEQCKTKWEDGIYTNVIVLQHDDELIMTGDSAFEIQCSYKSSGKSLEFSEAENLGDIVVRSQINLKDADPGGKDLPKDEQMFVGEDNETVILDPNVFLMSNQSKHKKIRTEEL